MKNSTTYKQFDKRWRWWLYPRKGWYLNGSGCGCLSVFHCCLELAKFEGKTPTEVMKAVHPYMRQFAVAGDGTKRDGITAGLKHFGFEDVFRCKSLPMSDLFKQLNKGGRIGVLLFNGRKAPNGTRWTSGGHYIAYTDYRIKDGRHEFYMKDSGGRNHTGWYSYERSMRGCVSDAWSAKIPEEKKKVTPGEGSAYPGQLPDTKVTETVKISNADKILKTAKDLVWPAGTAAKKYAYRGGAPTAKYKAAYQRAYPDRKGWSDGPRKGCACDVFVGTVARISGLDPDYPRGVTPAINKHKSQRLEKLVYKHVTPYSVSKEGDIICYFKNTAHTSAHTLIRGSGVIYEAQLLATYPHVNGSLSKLKTKRPVVVIFRAKPSEKTVTREYLHKGDTGSEVLKWQKFINWYNRSTVIAEDGVFGDFTKKYTEKFQEQNGLAVDGTVGVRTIEKAKTIKR